RWGASRNETPVTSKCPGFRYGCSFVAAYSTNDGVAPVVMLLVE
ncbi:MAG: hypothetical protein QOF79_267, partial [Actinomycetota bacterium]|nr:hypothetical protein [Actinomycetota bacterium]